MQEQADTGTNTSTGTVTPRTLRTLVLILIIALLAILNMSCYRYFSDGIQFAIELRYSLDWILHPHHVLYPFLPQIFYRVSGLAFMGFAELGFLIGWSKAMYLCSVLVLFLILSKEKFRPNTLAIGLGLFMFSHGVWYFGLTPNQNSTPLLYHIIALYGIHQLYNHDRPVKWVHIAYVTFLVSLSILASQVNAVLLLPLIYVLHVKSESRRKGILTISQSVLLTIVIVGMLLTAFGWKLGGFRSFADYVNWQHSYAFQERWWSGSFQDGFIRNMKGLFEVHIAGVFSTAGLFGDWTDGFGTTIWGCRLLLRIGQALAAIALLNEFIRASINYVRGQVLVPIQTIGLLAAVPILIFSVFYIPENLNLRILYIPGFILFMLPSIEQRYKFVDPERKWSLKGWPIHFGIAMLLLVNILGFYWPYSTPASNPRLADMVEMSEYVALTDLVIYPWTDEGHTDALYVQYFLDTEALTVNKLMDIEREYGGIAVAEILSTSEGERTIWIHMDVINPTSGSAGMAEMYNTDLTADEITAFIARQLIPTETAIRIDEDEYLAYELIDYIIHSSINYSYQNDVSGQE